MTNAILPLDLDLARAIHFFGTGRKSATLPLLRILLLTLHQVEEAMPTLVAAIAARSQTRGSLTLGIDTTPRFDRARLFELALRSLFLRE